jgi:pSer/pThr/pTyr-binding forkhead associated (FHA) protein
MMESLSARSVWKIGSSAACDIVVREPTVSGEHCQLSRYDDQYVLQDLGSTNGTFVNGFRLNPQTPVYVSVTDQITLGPGVAFQWAGFAFCAKPARRPASATQTLPRSSISVEAAGITFTQWSLSTAKRFRISSNVLSGLR